MNTPRSTSRRSALLRLAGLSCAVLLGATGPSSASPSAPIRVGGTGSGTVLLERLIEEYRKGAPNAAFEVVMPVLGSSGGLRALAAQRIDVAVLGRLPKVEEQRDSLVVQAWAETPLVLVSSNGKRAAGLDRGGLIALLRGEIGTWDDGSRINLVLRQPNESDNATLAKLSAEVRGALDGALRNPAATIADTDLDAIDLLTRTPGSLGTTTLGMMKLKNSRLKVLAFEGVTPSVAALRNGSYPLTKKLFLAHLRPMSGPAADFVAWLKSPAAAAKLNELEHLAIR